MGSKGRSRALPVAVIGAGMIKFGELFDQNYDDMVVGAYRAAVKSVDKGIDEKDVEAAWLGTALSGLTQRREALTGAALAEPLRFFPRPVSRNENACCTGSDAVRNAAFAVAAGAYDVVLALGAEKLRAIPSRDSMIGQVGMQFHRWWMPRGSSSPQRFGAFATAHMHQFGTTREHLAMVSVKNHYNGSLNPHAHFQNRITIEQALNAPMISWPLGLLDACPTTDGAAAVILARADIARQFTDKPLYFWGSGLATDTNHPGFKSTFTEFPANIAAGREAYEMAGIGPQDVSLAELHDCFSITELLSWEDLGFCKKGEGGKWIADGHPLLNGSKPCNTSGGLKAKGHPVGATGVAQIVELWEQIRGEAGPRQVKNARIGLTSNVGGPGAVCLVNIFAGEPR